MKQLLDWLLGRRPQPAPVPVRTGRWFYRAMWECRPTLTAGVAVC